MERSRQAQQIRRLQDQLMTMQSQRDDCLAELVKARHDLNQSEAMLRAVIAERNDARALRDETEKAMREERSLTLWQHIKRRLGAIIYG